MPKENLEKFLPLVTEKDSVWLEKAKWRKKHREWLQRSAIIAVRVLRILRERNMTKTELAGLMKVSPQQITKIVKGQENFTLETIGNLEKALGVTLMNIPQVEFTSAEVLLTETPLKKKMEITEDVPQIYKGTRSVSLGNKLSDVSDVTEQYKGEVAGDYDYALAA